MFEWSRNHLLEKIEGRPLEEIKQQGILPGKDGSKQWQVLNHFLMELYMFLDREMFSVEEKACLLTMCSRLFVQSFAGKWNAEQSKHRLDSELEKVSKVMPGSPSPLLRRSHLDLIKKYLQKAFFALYQFYAIAYVQYVDYNIQPWQPPNSQPLSHHKLVTGKVVADPSKIPALSEYVSENRPAQQPAKAKKK